MLPKYLKDSTFLPQIYKIVLSCSLNVTDCHPDDDTRWKHVATTKVPVLSYVSRLILCID
jgi:hypothetical protein